MDLFQQTKPRYSLPNRPKLFESFAGVGMQRMGFDRLGLEYEMVGISEIDKHAIQSYMAIHGETSNYGDITKIKGENLPQIDVFTYSFPCQDLSIAGKGKGMKEGTRSGLVFEVIRILRELKEIDRMPGLLIMENVTAILNKKHIEGFEQIKRELEELGYTNYVDKLNAKNYGVAQSRDRAWMISVLGDYYYEFPKPIPLEKRLKDYLESDVDEKYYISGPGIERMLTTTFESSKFKNRVSEADEVIGTLCARDYKDPKCVIEPNSKVGGGNTELKISETICLNSKVDGKQPSLQDRIYDSDGISTAITTGWMPNIAEPYLLVKLNQKHEQSGRIHGTDGISPTVMSNSHGKTDGGYTPIKLMEPSLRIRKLTPLECWRLMGIDDEDFHKAKASGVSNSQLYKQAGNGLVVDVFAALISTMINTQEVSIEMEVKMTVKELIEILTWCDDDKPVRISMGNKQIEIDNANEEDDCIVLIAS